MMRALRRAIAPAMIVLLAQGAGPEIARPEDYR